jgi:hypothetical protein
VLDLLRDHCGITETNSPEALTEETPQLFPSAPLKLYER